MLNDINGFHVTKDARRSWPSTARAADRSRGECGRRHGDDLPPLQGRHRHRLASLHDRRQTYTVGVLVQCNYGRAAQLRIAGVPVGTEIPGPTSVLCDVAGVPPARSGFRGVRERRNAGSGRGGGRGEQGSIIVVVATDAPLLPHQLKRVAKRVTLGIARMGGIGGDSSGDIFIAFSTANPGTATATGHPTATCVPNEQINPIFEATAQATEEVDRQRAGGRRDDDRRQRRAGDRAAARPAAGGAAEVQSAE